MTETPPEPSPELTRPEHPKQALAGFRSRAKIALMAFIALIALGSVVVLKFESKREEERIAFAKQQAEAERVARIAALATAIDSAYKGASVDAKQQALVARVGQAIAQRSDAKTYKPALQFQLLAEENAINLYAPGDGHIYVTTALVNRMKTEGQLAAALAHAIAHSMVTDEPTPLAKQPEAPALPLWVYSIAQERAADALAVKLMAQAGYDPNAMIGMFTVLADAYQAKADVGFFITHPNEKDRLQSIQNAILALYPNGIPDELSQ